MVAVNQRVAQVVSNVLLFGLVFCMSASVNARSIKRIHKTQLALGLSLQWLLMPLLGFIFVKAVEPQYEVALTVMILTSSPGGSLSNWFCAIFNADLPLSVAMTTLSTIISLGMLPLNLLLYTYLAFNQRVDISWSILLITIGVVISAVTGGLMLAYYSGDNPLYKQRSQAIGSLIGLAIILWSSLVTTVETKAPILNPHWQYWICICGPILCGLFFSLFIASIPYFNIPRHTCVAIAIEVCFQNVAISSVASMSMFVDQYRRDLAVRVALTYGGIEIIVLLVFCIVLWKMDWMLAPSTDSIMKMITNNYQIGTMSREDAREEREESSQDGTEVALPIDTSARSASDYLDDGKENGAQVEPDDGKEVYLETRPNPHDGEKGNATAGANETITAMRACFEAL
ncbi:hypothetical protein GUITHDRAFT_165182 [Guillardia theta CCMP2712]|uniref:Uncharacterized protein n=1 Tax=Guillardia theta (strain CCMP2712) TaxID=905079 RepID=L1IQG3_GUITC|nr:hypothetical protein GUITHDRAFT_165182 [Guillardia theta CCMP2712]EKX38536.1 hypothetical protein GUITHDRAFT_165182 [Guillardia theta CCMP2712]|eukprot:XP_005825516.1 hypothetical protein GUITHDRAFT_165182 [Guillardia theta CCMP2712]